MAQWSSVLQPLGLAVQSHLCSALLCVQLAWSPCVGLHLLTSFLLQSNDIQLVYKVLLNCLWCMTVNVCALASLPSCTHNDTDQHKRSIDGKMDGYS